MKILLNDVLVDAIVSMNDNQVASMQTEYRTLVVEKTDEGWFMLNSGAMQLVLQDGGEVVFQKIMLSNPDEDIRVDIHIFGTAALHLALDLADVMATAES